MKAAIITAHRARNYGAVLQAFATQELVRSLGWDTYFIDYRRPDQGSSASDVARFSRWGGSPITRVLYSYIIRSTFRRELDVFLGFARGSMVFGDREYDGIDGMRSDPPDADAYIVGSDQVWNPAKSIGGLEPFLLDFGRAEVPRLSFASSMGAAAPSDTTLDQVVQALRKFDSVSVRERSGFEVLRDRRVACTQVVDPTLCLERERWVNMAGPHRPGDPYVLSYCLGRPKGYSGVLNAARQAEKARVHHIHLKNLPQNRLRRGTVLPDVSEFLRLIRDAKHVVTDSFHGLVFALIFGVPVTVVPPVGFRTRVDSLLELTGLSERMIESGSDWEPWGGDWADVHSRLDNERLRAVDFLDRGLKTASLKDNCS